MQTIEEKKQVNKIWREKNKDKQKIAQRQWQLKNKEYCNDKSKEFYRNNKESINEKRRNNPKTMYSTIKRNARYRDLSLTITKEDFCEWWNNQKQECVYCGIEISRLKISDIKKKLSKRLSIDRKNNDIGYEKDNLVLACLQCNFIKSNLFTFEEMKEIGEKYIKPKWLL